MAVWDIIVQETGNGGDLTLLGNDLATTGSIETAVYLAMFGGNVEANTQTPRIITEQAFDYWANGLFMGQIPVTQFNSNTERALNNTALTSAGRVIIENAIKQDMAFLGTDVTVTVVIVSTDRINVTLRITLQNGTPGVATFSLVRNSSGDFDLFDFNFEDFF